MFGKLVVVIALASLAAGCGGGSAPVALVHTTVVKGPVYDGRVCAYRIDDAGSVATEPGDCERLDGSGSATLALSGTSQFLLVASDLRYRDESADGAQAALDGELEAVVATKAAGGSQSVAITPLTRIAVSSLRERGTALSGSAYEAMLDRVADATALGAEEARAVPTFDAAGQPADRAAATIAAFSDLGRDHGTGVSAQIERFVREFAKVHVDDDLLQFDRELDAAVAARLDLNPADPARQRVLVYGYKGTSGPAAAIGAERRCFARAHGLWTESLTFQTVAAGFSLCIAQAPAGGSCDAAFLRSLDFSGIAIHGANYSAEMLLRAALRAFTVDMQQYRLEFAGSCESYPTLQAALSRGVLYYPEFLAPME